MSIIKKDFHIKILGKLLEHLGVQMYKHRDAAIAELVANSWDAYAENVWIELPEQNGYSRETSIITIEDDGCGMDEKDLQDKYLVIGRNRRIDENSNEFKGRKVMGRKGIGKLAGFGIATQMKIQTWVNNTSIELTLNLDKLKNDPVTESKNDIEKKLEGIISDQKPSGLHKNSNSGTKITLSKLKQKTCIDVNKLNDCLYRRFSRSVQGHMTIIINGIPLKSISLDLHKNSPFLDSDLQTEKLEDGKIVKYSYSYSNTPIKESNIKGWTILANGKTAQAPPFYFNIDSTGRSQHSSKYLTGVIEADFLDSGLDDESDIIATDRQEIDWEREETQALKKWGEKLTQKIFNEIGERNSDESKNIVLERIDLCERINALDEATKQQCLKFIGSIGKIKVIDDEMSAKDKIFQMADQIIKAFEYSYFVDVIDDLEKASENPENLELLLTQLSKWEILESRSILEIIKGRLRVIDKFFNMIINQAPETANRTLGTDNFHDLIAGFPWLLNPEWQVFIEERSISNVLKILGGEDFKDEMSQKRIDFLALQGNDTVAVIEIKSIIDVLTLDEFRRLEDYKIKISSGTTKNVVGVLLFGGKYSLDKNSWDRYKNSEDFIILEWRSVFDKNKKYYEHYRAVLENHITDPNFTLKMKEVQNLRNFVNTDSIYRTPEDRKKGLGVQDNV